MRALPRYLIARCPSIGCPASAPMGRFEVIEQRRVSGSPPWSGDEPETRDRPPPRRSSRTSGVRPGGGTRPRRRSRSHSPGCAARTAWPSSVGARASRRACMTAGRRSFSKPASAVWRVMLPGAATADEVKDRRQEARALKEVVAEQALERRRLKKAGSRMGETTYEISRRRDARAIQPVGAPHAGTDRRAQRHLLPLVRSLSEPVAPEALEDRPSRPDRVWNRIPDGIRAKIIDQARAEPELSPCALAVPFTDSHSSFVSEASVYRRKAHELITGLAFIVVKAAAAFHTKTTSPNPLWQTDFTSLKVIGWGWYDPSTILDDFSRASSPGSWARRCAPRTSPTPRSGLAGLRRQSGPCPAQTPAPVGQRPQLSSPILLTGSTSGRAPTSVGHPASRRPRGRSSAGTKRLRTPSGSKIMICRATSTPRSRPPSSVTPTAGITRASTIGSRPVISAVAKPSGSSGNAATARPSTSVVGFTASKPHKISPPDEPQPPLSQAAIRPKCVDDGRGRDLKNWMRRRNLRFRWLCRVIVVINAAPFSGLFCCSPQGGATRVGR